MKKNYFSCHNFLACISLLVLITSRSISALSWCFGETQKSKMAVMALLWRHHFSLLTSKNHLWMYYLSFKSHFNSFFYHNVSIFSLYKFIGFDYFSFNFGTFLIFWGNPEIQDSHHGVIMTSSPLVIDLKGTIFGCTIYPPSLTFIASILVCPLPRPQRTNKQTFF